MVFMKLQDGWKDSISWSSCVKNSDIYRLANCTKTKKHFFYVFPSSCISTYTLRIHVFFMRTSHLAQVPREAGQTQTLEAVHLVLTAAAVQTRRAGTVVHIPLTVLASKAWGTRAAIPVHQVLREAQTQINVGCM